MCVYILSIICMFFYLRDRNFCILADTPFDMHPLFSLSFVFLRHHHCILVSFQACLEQEKRNRIGMSEKIEDRRKTGKRYVEVFGTPESISQELKYHMNNKKKYQDLMITTTEMLICPGSETLVVPVSQPETPGRDKRGIPFVPGLATGTKSLFFSCFPFLNSFSISVVVCKPTAGWRSAPA